MNFGISCEVKKWKESAGYIEALTYKEIVLFVNYGRSLLNLLPQIL